MVTLESALERAAANNRALTLAEAGGPGTLLSQASQYTTTPHLPLLVPALVEGGKDNPDLLEMLNDALRSCTDAATFDAAVERLPSDAGLLATSLVPALLDRINDANSHIAACALTGAAGVAMASCKSLPVARVAVALSQLTGDASDSVALAAVRTAGALFDAQTEDQAVREAVDETLSRFEDHPWVDTDVAIERAHRQLVDALGAEEENITAALDAAASAFEALLEDDPERIDAAITACGIRSVLSFSTGELDADSATNLEQLLDQRSMYSSGTPDAVSRRDREIGWGLLAAALTEAETPLSDDVWLEASHALMLLVDAVRLSRAQKVGGSDLEMVVMPRLRTPFVDQAHHTSLLARYAERIIDDSPRADAASALIRAARIRPKEAGSDALESLVGALKDAGLNEQECEAISALHGALSAATYIHRNGQWWQAFAKAAHEIKRHDDANTLVGQKLVGVLAHILDFIATRFDLTRGKRDHLAYLRKPDALEQELADDLVVYLRYWFGPHVRTEVSDVGGGRVDVIIDTGAEKIVIECKRDKDPWTAGTQRGWATQASTYLSTGLRIGLMVLLDLSDKTTGPSYDLADSLNTFAYTRKSVDHLVICGVVPGNQQTSPSAIGKAARAAERARHAKTSSSQEAPT